MIVNFGSRSIAGKRWKGLKPGGNADVFFTKAQYAGSRYVLVIILPIAGVMITATFYNAVHGAHPLTPTGM